MELVLSTEYFGLKYFLFHHSFISAILGITFNFLWINVILLTSFLALVD
jgi:hypothetical protein